MAQEPASPRSVDQRLRNRIMEQLLLLSEGDAGVREAGTTEWFESFFDYFEYEGEKHPRAELSTLSPAEVEALRGVVSTMQQACRNTPRQMTERQLIVSGWPLKAQVVAQAALDLFMERGRYSEDIEEEQPSSPVPWPR